MTPERIKQLRVIASVGHDHLEPEVTECLDEIERLQAENEKLIAQYAMLRATTRKAES